MTQGYVFRREAEFNIKQYQGRCSSSFAPSKIDRTSAWVNISDFLTGTGIAAATVPT